MDTELTAVYTLTEEEYKSCLNPVFNKKPFQKWINIALASILIIEGTYQTVKQADGYMHFLFIALGIAYLAFSLYNHYFKIIRLAKKFAGTEHRLTLNRYRLYKTDNPEEGLAFVNKTEIIKITDDLWLVSYPAGTFFLPVKLSEFGDVQLAESMLADSLKGVSEHPVETEFDN